MTWWRSLSVLLCILTALVSPRTASGASAVQAETRVKGFFLVATALVGGSSARSVERHSGNAVAYEENASGSVLAAEGVEGVALAEGQAASAGMQAHHIFPQQLAGQFEQAGVVSSWVATKRRWKGRRG